MGEPMQFI